MEEILSKQANFVDQCISLCSDYFDRSINLTKLKDKLAAFLRAFFVEIKELELVLLDQRQKMESKEPNSEQAISNSNHQFNYSRNQLLVKIRELQLLNNGGQEVPLNNQDVTKKDQIIQSLTQQLDLSNQQIELLKFQLSKLEHSKRQVHARAEDKNRRLKQKYKDQYEKLKQKGQEKIHRLKDIIIQYQTNLQTHFFEIGQLNKIIASQQQEKHTITQQLITFQSKQHQDFQQLESTFQERFHLFKNELSLKFLTVQQEHRDPKYTKIKSHLATIISSIHLCKQQYQDLRFDITSFPKIESLRFIPTTTNLSSEISQLIKNFESQMARIKKRISDQMVYRKEMNRSSVITTASLIYQSQTPEEEDDPNQHQQMRSKISHSHTQSAFCSPVKFQDKYGHLSSYIMKQQKNKTLHQQSNIQKNLLLDFEAAVKIKKPDK